MVKEDMARNQMTTEMAEDRKHWHVMILAGTLLSLEVGVRETVKHLSPANLPLWEGRRDVQGFPHIRSVQVSGYPSDINTRRNNRKSLFGHFS